MRTRDELETRMMCFVIVVVITIMVLDTYGHDMCEGLRALFF